MAPATELLDELIEEIFLRIHPADAVTLARAALVCRRWCRLITDPAFRRRLREHHRRSPMLGFSCNIEFGPIYIGGGPFYAQPVTIARFVRTSSCGLERVDMDHSRVIDTRHGRILLHRASPPDQLRRSYLFVWDPITKEEHTLPWPPLPVSPHSWNAAVLCAAAGCDHLDCHGKPFTVVLVTTRDNVIYDLVYSSEAGRWREEKAAGLFVPKPEDHLILQGSALVGDALYFVLRTKTRILKYSVGTREMHTIHLPPACFSEPRILLMPMEDGGLGFATVQNSKLCLWSRDGDSDKDVGWTQRRVIDLKALLPIHALVEPADVVGFADGVGFAFIKTDYGHFRIEMKSNRVEKVQAVFGASTIFPYMSFHTPVLGAVAASRGEGPSMGASSA